MTIIFDSETTGLILDYKINPSEFDKFPRIIQLAWVIFDETGKEVKRVCKLIKPEGWVIPREEFFIKNGYSTERSEAEGFPIFEVLTEFVQDRLKAHYQVAHNINFDAKIIRAEMFRMGLIDIEFKAKKVCTMNKSTKYCQIPAKNGKKGVKFPTLTELHNKLFNAGFESAHDAGSDVDACARCFFELMRLKVIELDKI